MGEIIIKVPEDVREVIELEIPYKEVKEKLEELSEDENLIKKFFSVKLPEEIKTKTAEETIGDFYEGIIEIND